MRKGHLEQIERWAKYVKNNSNWKLKQKGFIDSQIIIARRFYKKLAKTKEGMKKIKELRAKHGKI